MTGRGRDVSASASAAASASGGGFVGLLAVALIVLKLCEVIDWPWWQVLAPIWISTILAAVALSGLAVLCLYVAAVEDREDRARRARRAGDPAPHEHGPARRWRRR